MFSPAVMFLKFLKHSAKKVHVPDCLCLELELRGKWSLGLGYDRD